MFQFTTTNVINSNFEYGYTPTGVATDDNPHALWSSVEGDDKTEGSFHVKRVNNFKKSNVVHIYKAEATPSQLDKVTYNFTNITAKDGEGFRLEIYIRLSQSCQSSYYSNDMVFKGKPFGIEFSYKTNWKTTLEKLKKTIEKYAILVYEKPLLKVSVNDTFLTIEATDEYQRLHKVDVERYDPEAYHGMGKYVVEKSIEDINKVDDRTTLTGSVEGYFVGQEGFGTYQWLLHNLRLPTTMRTRIYAMNSDETPIPGAKYNQYTIHYCVNRGILGNNAVGDLVKSITTHVFYVNSELVDKFEAALTNIAPEEGIIAISDKRNAKTEDSDTEIEP